MRVSADAGELDQHAEEARGAHLDQVDARRVAGVDEQRQSEADELREGQPRRQEARPVVVG